VAYYDQQFLINYKHWNEEKFFDNEIGEFTLPSFSIDGVKFGVINGFELHFDVAFAQVMKKGVDVILSPSASTFDSSARWIELLKMRAFTNSVYILRSNRVGIYKEGPKPQIHPLSVAAFGVKNEVNTVSPRPTVLSYVSMGLTVNPGRPGLETIGMIVRVTTVQSSLRSKGSTG
jgi:predicted amidohydrolase